MALADLLLGSLWEYLSGHADELKPDAPREEAAEAVAALEAKWAQEPNLDLDNLSPAEYLARLNGEQEWTDLLKELARRDALPGVVREAVAARGESLTPLLIRLLEAQEGKVSELAAVLLADLQAEAAVPALVRLAAEVPEFTDLGDAVVGALERIGEAARAGLYGLCEEYQADVESVPYSRAVEILTRLPQDDRTWAWLKRGLSQAGELKMFYAVLAGDYGDARAVGPLTALLADESLSADDRQEIAESVMLCGGASEVLQGEEPEEGI